MKTDSGKIGKGCYATRFLGSLRSATRLYSDGAILAGKYGGYPLTSRKDQKRIFPKSCMENSERLWGKNRGMKSLRV